MTEPEDFEGREFWREPVETVRTEPRLVERLGTEASRLRDGIPTAAAVLLEAANHITAQEAAIAKYEADRDAYMEYHVKPLERRITAQEDIIRRYREALEQIAGAGVVFDARGSHSKRVVELARHALNSSDAEAR